MEPPGLSGVFYGNILLDRGEATAQVTSINARRLTDFPVQETPGPAAERPARESAHKGGFRT